MLSTITAAETQFRREYETRQREFAMLASIQERRAETAAAKLAVASALTQRSTTRAAWARPIGIAMPAAATCAA